MTRSSDSKKKLNLRQALFVLWLPTIAVFGLAFAAHYGWEFFKDKLVHDPRYHIEALILKSSSKEPLDPSIMAEFLNLSCDYPTNLFLFPLKSKESELKAHPLFTSFSLSAKRPNSLIVEYSLRVPIAFLGDLDNTAIDEKGILFPVRPFYSQKNLPTIFLGDQLPARTSLWGQKLESKRAKLSLYALQIADEKALGQWRISSIDASRLSLENAIQNELIITLERGVAKNKQTLYLRLSPENIEQGFSKFLSFKDIFGRTEEKSAIDLRYDDFALIKHYK